MRPTARRSARPRTSRSSNGTAGSGAGPGGGPRPISPPPWEGQTLFSLPDRAALKRAVEFGLEDTFRRLHPEPGRYSWWDYRMLGFQKNRGLRLDHIYAAGPLATALQAAGIDRGGRKGAQTPDP